LKLGPPNTVAGILVGQDILDSEAAVLASLMERDPALIEQAHKVLPRYVQESCSLLRCKFTVHGHYRDRISTGHDLHHSIEEAKYAFWKGDPFASWANELD
jgi:hypothetical protein